MYFSLLLLSTFSLLPCFLLPFPPSSIYFLASFLSPSPLAPSTYFHSLFPSVCLASSLFLSHSLHIFLSTFPTIHQFPPISLACHTTLFPVSHPSPFSNHTLRSFSSPCTLSPFLYPSSQPPISSLPLPLPITPSLFPLPYLYHPRTPSPHISPLLLPLYHPQHHPLPLTTQTYFSSYLHPLHTITTPSLSLYLPHIPLLSPPTLNPPAYPLPPHLPLPQQMAQSKATGAS